MGRGGTSASVDEIATRCGFGTTTSLRVHFRRHVATTPTASRNAFAARRQSPGVGLFPTAVRGV
jgi:AraC family transcriptional activator FtrA